MQAARREVLGLALRAFAWLPVTLAAWYFASHVLAWAPSQLAAPAMSLAGVNAKVARLSDGVAVFEARLQPPYRPGIAAVEEVEAAVELKTRTFTFGIALFLALSLSLALGRPWRPGPVVLWVALDPRVTRGRSEEDQPGRQ